MSSSAIAEQPRDHFGAIMAAFKVLLERFHAGTASSLKGSIGMVKQAGKGLDQVRQNLTPKSLGETKLVRSAALPSARDYCWVGRRRPSVAAGGCAGIPRISPPGGRGRGRGRAYDANSRGQLYG